MKIASRLIGLSSKPVPKPTPLDLDNIRVASPCPASWERMTGDDRVRHCQECKLNVYNLSEMTRVEAERLIASREGRMCVRFYRRADGTILTRDCPRGLQAIIRRVSRLAGAALSAFMSLNLSAIQVNVQPGSQTTTQNDQDLGNLDLTVTDPLGAVIVNAQVTLIGERGQRVKLVTNSLGQVHFSGVSAGKHVIFLTAGGFEDVWRTVEMQKGKTVALVTVLPMAALQGFMIVAEATPVPVAETLPNPELKPYRILLPIQKDKKHR
jgi:hypothetical protein